MVYFLQDMVTKALKIGYSVKPPRRLRDVQNTNQNKLTLLYAMHGELDHEAELLLRFEKFRMEGEWFRPDVYPHVSQIIAADRANPRQLALTVLVTGEIEPNQEGLVSQALSEIHTKTPIYYVVTSGQRLLDHAAWAWANQNKVKVYRYFPNWRRHKRGGGTQAALRMLKARFDQKHLLVFLPESVRPALTALIKTAEKKKIPVITKTVPSRFPPRPMQ